MVRATLTNAIVCAKEYFEEIEQSVFVLEVQYPSGIEFHIRPETQTNTNDKRVVYKIELKQDHKFKIKDNALKAMEKFKCTEIKPYIEIEKGYKKIKYYYLCSK